MLANVNIWLQQSDGRGRQSCAHDEKGPCGRSVWSRPAAPAGRNGQGHREMPSGRDSASARAGAQGDAIGAGQRFCSGAGTSSMLLQPPGVQGGLRNNWGEMRGPGKRSEPLEDAGSTALDRGAFYIRTAANLQGMGAVRG